VFERSRRGERALLVQPQPPGAADPSLLDEFTELARSAGAGVVGVLTSRLEHPNPRFFIGSGKADELKSLREQTDADLVLVNHALTPVQERNLERHLECRVVDRTGLILDIFAQRARSHEGKLQVELAQLKHMATRLVRGWSHLERQRGGAIGLRGPGETQLETDRRLLAERVKALQARLAKVEKQRMQARRARLRRDMPLVSLVGYTNAGKSTLFNALTDAGVFAADQLFATLDPTLRRLGGLGCGPVVLADTVGFVRDLPHDLIAAFRSTLAETRDADLLLHVIDAADPERDVRIGQVDAVLEEVGAGAVPRILVYNKIDLLDLDMAPRVDASVPPRVWLSAARGEGMEPLRKTIADLLGDQRLQEVLHLPHSEARLRARLFDAGAVAGDSEEEGGWRLEVDMPRSMAMQMAHQHPPLAALLEKH
jgi:GTPase